MPSTKPESAQLAAELALAADIGSLTHDPLRYALYAFPWGSGELVDSKGPRQWQREELDKLGAHLRNPETRHKPYRGAIASGHGIGKSAFVAMVTKWAMDTCEDCKVVITANTDTQLRTKTWPEVAKWARMAITSHWFKVPATAMYSTELDREKTWRADAVPWSENNTEAFAGLHNVGKRIVLIMDEASAIADKVWEVAEGALTDAGTEIIWFVFGNPTRASGRFRECFRNNRHRWNHRQVDAREVEGTNHELHAEWAQDYGVDSDFFKVRVRGMFPSMSVKQFISEADVDAAFGKHLREDQYNWAPKIISVDPAWQGDDELVIGFRQGLMFRVLETMPKNDNDVLVAQKVARYEDELKADAVFIDGGYGTGIVSVGRTLGRDWMLVWFGGESADPGCLNKRSEMWESMRKWLKEGGAIPADNVLRDDLTGIEVMPRLDGKIALESKESMKKRGLKSPNRADGLAITFAFPVAHRNPEPLDPLFGMMANRTQSTASPDWDPFG